MNARQKPDRAYTIVGPEAYRPPDYKRVVEQLTVAELRTEVEAGRGGDDYQAAARAELARREARR